MLSVRNMNKNLLLFCSFFFEILPPNMSAVFLFQVCHGPKSNAGLKVVQLFVPIRGPCCRKSELQGSDESR